MTSLISIIIGLLGTFFAGMFVFKAQADAQEIKKMKKIGKAYDKIDAESDTRSDVDVLRKHKR